MKIFNNLGSKVNFVDDNNVLLGYDLWQSCCEDADWFISNKVEDEYLKHENYPTEFEFDGWNFDTDFSRESGYSAIFRICNTEGQQKFIHLYNCHNGYYSHGFTLEVGGRTIFQGSI